MFKRFILAVFLFLGFQVQASEETAVTDNLCSEVSNEKFVSELFGQVDQVIGNNLKKPDYKLWWINKPIGSQCDPGYSCGAAIFIKVPRVEDICANVKAVNALYVHEYGHAYFHVNFQYDKKPICKAWGKLMDKQKTLSKIYDEFFSDIMAVIFTDDPESVSGFLISQGESKEKANIRNFTADQDRILWGKCETDLYGCLKFSRKQLWQTYLNEKKRLGTTFDKGVFIAQIFQVISAELNNGLNNERWFTMDYKEMNKSLRESLMKKFQKKSETVSKPKIH